jgi:hypothetical protein
MKELIFVYNAESGRINGLLDYLHKTISPSTYQCQLCAITHSHKMHDEWRDFIRNLGVPVHFLHRDELADQFGITNTPLPAVFEKIDQKLYLKISADEINKISDLTMLQERISELLNE